MEDDQLKALRGLLPYQETIISNFVDAANYVLEEINNEKDKHFSFFSLYFNRLMRNCNDIIKQIEVKSHYEDCDKTKDCYVNDDPTHEGQVVYLIGDLRSSVVKIGTSRSIRQRLSSLRNQSSAGKKIRIVGYYPGGRAEESFLHRRFSHLRLHGEWFQPDAEIVRYFKEMAENKDGRFYSSHAQKLKIAL